MQKIMKSAQHHWWPRCVSKYWGNSDGFVNWVNPDGIIKRIRPANLGMIGNGHHIKLSSDLSQISPFDSSFESTFDCADRNFQSIINWLSSLIHTPINNRDFRRRFIPEAATDEQLRLLTECVVSLAVRSPMNREASVALAEKFRGRIPTPERNALIGLNMRNSQRTISDAIGCNGKFAVLFSENKEFVFGDGIFNNVSGCTNPPYCPKILVAITPTISVIVSKPSMYETEPRISTFVLTDDEVDKCNHGVQVYSKSALFFRTEQPQLTDAFTCNQHLQYDLPTNPLDTLIDNLPGTKPTTRYF